MRWLSIFARSVAAMAILGAVTGDCLTTADDEVTSSEDRTAAASPRTPSTADIDRWIADLDADQFAVRENASQKLRDAGRTVIERLAETADGPHAEASARAAAILDDWSRSEQPDLQLAALQRLVALKHHPALKRRAKAELAVHHERRALKRLLALGAKVPDRGSFSARGGVLGDKIVIDQGWKGRSEDLALLRHLQAVRTVGFYALDVSVEMVEAAAEMPELERLELYGTGITPEEIPEEIAKLQEGMPHVQFDIRRGAMLGVRGSGRAGVGGPAMPAIIQYVEPKTAAARAGLRMGDIVMKVDGQRVADFEALTAEIAKHGAGDDATLEINRGGKTFTKKVVFDRWRVLDNSRLPE